MDRKQGIIVSIVGLFIVLLALVGLTYGYYLTRIVGNTNTNSIYTSTADLRLVYSDGTTQILTKENIVPGTTIGLAGNVSEWTLTNHTEQANARFVRGGCRTGVTGGWMTGTRASNPFNPDCHDYIFGSRVTLYIK